MRNTLPCFPALWSRASVNIWHFSSDVLSLHVLVFYVGVLTCWWWPISFSNVSPSAWNRRGQADMIPSFRLSQCVCTIKCFSRIHKCLLSLLSLLCLRLRPSWQLNYNVTGMICTCDCQWDERCVVSYSQGSCRPSACAGGWIGWSRRVHGPACRCSLLDVQENPWMANSEKTAPTGPVLHGRG